MAPAGYDPNRTLLNPHHLGAFIQAPIKGNLLEVPGIGPATVKAMNEAGMTTTFELIGKYMSLKAQGVDSEDHCDRFFYWLKDIGTAAGYRSSVVQAIAQKMDITFPGIYDASCYE